MSLYALPDELLLRILELVQEVDPVIQSSGTQCSTSLINLLHTSRRLNRLATPFAYEDLNSQRNHLSRFIDAITKTPKLGGLVKNIYWECRDYEDYDGMTMLARQDTFSRVGGWLESLEHDPQWVEQFPDLLAKKRKLAACLKVVPNLERLSVVDFFGGDDEVHWLGAGWGGNPFERLGTMNIRVSKLHFRNLAPVFKLRSMRRLELSGMAVIAADETVQSAEDENSTWGLPRHASPIEHLHIKHSCLPSPTISSLLHLPKRLRSFELHSIGRSPPDYTPITSALSHHTPYLHTLTLYDTSPSPPPTQTPLLSSLSTFSLLTHLALPFPYLFSRKGSVDPSAVRGLPETVASLGLAFMETEFEHEEGWRNQFTEGLVVVAESKRAGFLGGLREVVVDGSTIWQTGVGDAEYVGSQMGMVGVRFVRGRKGGGEGGL